MVVSKTEAQTDVQKCFDIGEAAVTALIQKAKRERNLTVVSVGGTEKDLKHGIDYEILGANGMVAQAGAHRHMNAKYEFAAVLRYKRKSGMDTDFQKLADKPDNFLYSFSVGSIGTHMTITTTTARSIRKWVSEKNDVLSHYIQYPFGIDDNAFLVIPFSELDNVKEF